MEKAAEPVEGTRATSDVDRLVDHAADPLQLRRAAVERRDVALRHIGRGPLDAGVEKHQRRGELLEPRRGEDNRPNRDLPRAREEDVVEATVGGTDLILRSDRLAEDILLNVDALVGELAAADHSPLEGVKRHEEADGEG